MRMVNSGSHLTDGTDHKDSASHAPLLTEAIPRSWRAQMKRALPGLLVVAAAAVSAGCSPYDTWGHGEFNAGPVDPASFPPAYLGFKSTTQGPYGRNRGAGRFVEVSAYLNGNRKGYYAFPFTTAQLALADTLRVKDDVDPSTVPPVGNRYG